jgi:hypothetical protein
LGEHNVAMAFPSQFDTPPKKTFIYSTIVLYKPTPMF